MAYDTSSQTRLLVTVLTSVCGLAASATVLWLALRDTELAEQQFAILRIVLALAGGGVGAVIPGFLDLNLNSGGRFALRAGGGLAVFAVLYVWSPARWQPAVHADVTSISAPSGAAADEIGDSRITIDNPSTSTPPAK